MHLFLTIKSLYAMNGVAAVLLYVPQIISVWKRAGDPRSLSLVTFGGWGIGSIITFLYALLSVRDPLFAAVSFGNLLGSGAVFCLVASRRIASPTEPKLVSAVNGGPTLAEPYPVGTLPLTPPRLFPSARN